MSCAACEGAQYRGPYDDSQPAFYVRVGTGNVQVVACRDHAKQLMDLLRLASEAKACPHGKTRFCKPCGMVPETYPAQAKGGQA